MTRSRLSLCHEWRSPQVVPPVYEGLPWVYLLGGLLALIASYFQTSSGLSLILGLPGLFVFMAGYGGVAEAAWLSSAARPV